ncbi:proteinase [Pseudovirgaria hyperparasitica]|uniref:Proteinase n=1 Tax=Pseudovirgaria hyperparasitica TaxID=470096 RepID=A0A6A6WJA0_9PEZI|nr:proteinase [Pseudovirgaria hyperparasitica]KAF2761837.1 proteinase [Pseudovirgaria hyperparasitica]
MQWSSDSKVGLAGLDNGKEYITPDALLAKKQRKPSSTIYLMLGFVFLLFGWHFWDGRRVLGVSVGGDAAVEEAEKAEEAAVRWSGITPSTHLEYHDCYNSTYQCARLEVPMDWNCTDGKGSKMQIAVIRLPAPVPVTDARYGGPVFVNPGGPGGSGVGMVLAAGSGLQTIVNPEGDLGGPSDDPNLKIGKYFDIISFDPRGIGLTTPSISCFPDANSRMNWQLGKDAIGLLGSSETALTKHWYRSKARGEGCSVAMIPVEEGANYVGEHVNTTPVIRDMLEIAEKHQDWVHKQLKEPHEPKELQRRQEPVKLQYWGFSYGTIIGQTFAAMYPDRVARIAVDGVVDPNDYHHGPWFTNLPDTDKILWKLFEHCAEAGPEDCPMYVEGGSDAIMASYDRLLRDIWFDPLPVPASLTRGPDVITWSDMISFMRMAIYQPLAESKFVADVFGALAKGNGSAFADWKQSETAQSCPTKECKLAGPYSPPCNRQNGGDASSAIMCTDSPGLGQLDISAFSEYMEALANQSSVLGYWWSHERLGCVGWKAKAKWRFDGPFTGNTAHPLLFIGNTLDPVTPLANAARMSKQYKDAVLLQQDCEGHTTIASPSICTAKAVRNYFQTGATPKTGTICPPIERPFVGRIEKEEKRNSEDQRILDAIESIRLSLRLSREGW